MRLLSLAVITGFALLFSTACRHTAIAPSKLVGIWHEVSSGDTAGSVAARYGAEESLVVELNDLPKTGALDGRREIFVPTSKGTVPGRGEKPTREVTNPQTAAAGSADVAAANAPRASCGTEGRPCFAWPAAGKLGAVFGAKIDHDGIDIAAPKGTPVVAAEKGRVIYSGDGIKGYGNMILIRHENGLITVYAHNDANDVKEGDSVERGQKIASMGQSGSATAPHLHFEVREGESPRDPLAYLPKENDR